MSTKARKKSREGVSPGSRTEIAQQPLEMAEWSRYLHCSLYWTLSWRRWIFLAGTEAHGESMLVLVCPKGLQPMLEQGKGQQRTVLD